MRPITRFRLWRGTGAPARRPARQPARQRPARHRWRGQSLVEFALVLPILLGLMGAMVDFARVNEVRIRLESATRDAAEYVAMTATSSSMAATEARRVVCTAFEQSDTCSSPTVAVSGYSSNTSAPGAAAAYPLVTATVSTSTSFQTLFPYPFLTDRGATTLTASYSYSVLQNR
jgi:Flp pilus assembly protein TadG